MRTLGEAHELEQRNEGSCDQLARLGAAGCGVQLHPDDPILDGHLRNHGHLPVPAQGAVLLPVLQWAGVLLVAHVHLQRRQSSLC